MNHYAIGLGWILVAGVTQGAFMLPMKAIRRWKFEHLWMAYSIVAFMILPIAIAIITVPHLSELLTHGQTHSIVMIALFGLGWGIGSVFFGLGVDALGLALGFSLATGIYTALGALLPMMILTPALLWTRNGALIIAGNLIMIGSVVLLAMAGELRDRQRGSTTSDQTSSIPLSFTTGLIVCILSGILSGMLNFVYAFGKPLTTAAISLGANSVTSLNVLWAVALPVGGAINILYCAYLMSRKRNWSVFFREGRGMEWSMSLAMAALWTGSVIVYGWGANQIGALGSSLGWSLWNALTIVTTLVCGLMTHEWDGVKGRAMNLLLAGIALLIVSSAILGLGGGGS
jgi:L-rhamnose-H+ transport protein